MSHTVGPWRCEASTPGAGHHCIIAADGNYVVCPDDGWNDNYRNYDERFSNARLIAAAPDLLVALKALLPLARYAPDELGSADVAEAERQIAHAESVIAKAEGR